MDGNTIAKIIGPLVFGLVVGFLFYLLLNEKRKAREAVKRQSLEAETKKQLEGITNELKQTEGTYGQSLDDLNGVLRNNSDILRKHGIGAGTPDSDTPVE
jgi:uncharacterized membrane-anchored protein YhcB (DUF1043 family)